MADIKDAENTLWMETTGGPVVIEAERINIDGAEKDAKKSA